MNPIDVMRVCICVATYLRPHLLSRLLESLLSQVDEVIDECAVRIVVVDNDPDASARDTVQGFEGRTSAQIEYVVEPRPGIAPARNRALRAWAGDGSVVFIDDDETADPGWLRALLEVQLLHDGDIVTGPVLPEYEEGVPEWIKEGGFFDRPRYRTGTRLSLAATNNVLLREAVLAAQPLWFDESFGMNGGDDTHLFLRLRQRGFSIVWADDAVVRDWVPRSRANPSWLLRRALRGGTSYAVAEAKVAQSARTRVVRVLIGLLRALQGTGLVLVGLLRFRRILMLRGGRVLMTGIGMVAGAAGWLYQEYGR